MWEELNKSKNLFEKKPKKKREEDMMSNKDK